MHTTFYNCTRKLLQTAKFVHMNCHWKDYNSEADIHEYLHDENILTHTHAHIHVDRLNDIPHMHIYLSVILWNFFTVY